MPNKIIPDFYELKIYFQDCLVTVNYFRNLDEISRYISVNKSSFEKNAYRFQINECFLYYEEVESDYVV